MPRVTSNWTSYHMPFQPLDTFTRHEPFPEEEKATALRGLDDKPKRGNRKLLLQALEKRWSDGTRR